MRKGVTDPVIHQIIQMNNRAWIPYREAVRLRRMLIVSSLINLILSGMLLYQQHLMKPSKPSPLGVTILNDGGAKLRVETKVLPEK